MSHSRRGHHIYDMERKKLKIEFWLRNDIRSLQMLSLYLGIKQCKESQEPS